MAGCHHVQLGIESMNEDVRRNVLIRKETNEQIVKGLDTMEEAGLGFSADIMIGLPGESEEDIILAIKTLGKYRRLIRASIFWLQYLPGVAITRMAMDKGVIGKGEERQINEGLQDNYLSTGSVMESSKKRILKTYHIMFRLLPILPRRFIDFLIDSGLFKTFRFVPFQVFFIVCIDVFVSFVKRDYYAKWIMGWYFRQILKHIFHCKITVMSD